MASVLEIANTYIEEMASLDPIAATFWGVPGHDDLLPDLSPEGVEARGDLERRTLRALGAPENEGAEERIAAEVMAERLEASLVLHDTGEDFRSLRVLHSPQGAIRQCFDLMGTEDEAAWELIAGRLGRVPQALDELRATLEEGITRDLASPARQVRACAEQCDTWGGRGEGASSFFARLVARYPGRSGETVLTERASRAAQSYLEFGDWLRERYLPAASEKDAVGADRYAQAARYYTGADLDLADTYAFGWAELHRIELRIAEVCSLILPGAGFAEVVAHLEAGSELVIEGVEAFQEWNQRLIDETVVALNGMHFDIPVEIQRCEAMIAPPGGVAAMYYTQPSEDLSRPGRTWYPTLGKTRFPLWREVSVCYHEGVPGHHLQIGQLLHMGERLNRYQRLAGRTSGHSEGWALYAERLMGELGYLDQPAFDLGMLAAQAMRAVRVIVDIGMHLELSIPADEDYHPGERWTPELALPFVIERSRFPADFMASEVDRYLGLPGQAISYKVGERVWLEGRDAARGRHGGDFDLKAFHAFALGLGGMGLDQLRQELARF
ncbi:MAG: DUF885 domain-containing protein [Acidimicrobiales bacterium]